MEIRELQLHCQKQAGKQCLLFPRAVCSVSALLALPSVAVKTVLHLWAMLLCLSRRCCHFSRRRTFLWLPCREEAFVK